MFACLHYITRLQCAELPIFTHEILVTVKLYQYTCIWLVVLSNTHAMFFHTNITTTLSCVEHSLLLSL